MTMSRWWVQPTLFGLALSSLVVSIALHLATFGAPTLPTNLHWLELVYPLVLNPTVFIVSLFNLRRSPGLRLSVAQPPQSSFVQRLRARFRAAPPFARAVYGLGALLCGYSILMSLQLCALFGTLKSDGYYLHFWSALGIFYCFTWTLSAAKALGWWGQWQAAGQG